MARHYTDAKEEIWETSKEVKTPEVKITVYKDASHWT